MFLNIFKKHSAIKQNDLYVLKGEYNGFAGELRKDDIALITSVYSDNLCEVYYPRLNTSMMELVSNFTGRKASFKLMTYE